MPSGTQRNSNSVTIPKLPPPPRTPQKRSAFSSALAVTNSPSAVTRSTDTRWSTESPYLRWIQPIPPPSVSPATPVCVTIPGRHREPEGLSLAVELAEQHACLDARGSSLRVDAHALQRREVDHERVVGDGESGEGMPAAPDRHREAALASELDGGDHIGDAGAAHDHRGLPVDRAVPDPAVQVVARIARADDLTAEGGVVDLDRVGDGGHGASLAVEPSAPGRGRAGDVSTSAGDSLPCMCAQSVCRLALTPEGRSSLEQLVEHARERVLIRAPVHLAVADLLGCEVSNSRPADRMPWFRPRRLRRQAESQRCRDPHVDEHVPGPHVAMHETAGMGASRASATCRPCSARSGRKRPDFEGCAKVGAGGDRALPGHLAGSGGEGI